MDPKQVMFLILRDQKNVIILLPAVCPEDSPSPKAL